MMGTAFSKRWALYGASAGVLLAHSPSPVAADDFYKQMAADIRVAFASEADVDLRKQSRVSKSVVFEGTVGIAGRVEAIDLAAFATVDTNEVLSGNDVALRSHGVPVGHSSNHATLSVGAFNGAGGNAGLNIAAGDINIQDNGAVIAFSGWCWWCGVQPPAGSADASAAAVQVSNGNAFTSATQGSINIASLNGAILNGAGGNFGVNIAAGSLNAQKNALAIAATEADAVLAAASATALQQADANAVRYDGGHANAALLGAGIANGLNGNAGVNIAAGSNNLQMNTLAIATTGHSGGVQP